MSEKGPNSEREGSTSRCWRNRERRLFFCRSAFFEMSFSLLVPFSIVDMLCWLCRSTLLERKRWRKDRSLKLTIDCARLPYGDDCNLTSFMCLFCTEHRGIIRSKLSQYGIDVLAVLHNCSFLLNKSIPTS